MVARVEGYKKRFTLLTTAADLSGLQALELFCARFRQEDGFRDLKQRLGWEECRAWARAVRARWGQRPERARKVQVPPTFLLERCTLVSSPAQAL